MRSTVKFLLISRRLSLDREYDETSLDDKDEDPGPQYYTGIEQYDLDPEMELFRSMDDLMIIKKLEVISRWLEIITFHTRKIAEKYQEFEWVCPVDRMADDIIATNAIIISVG